MGEQLGNSHNVSVGGNIYNTTLDRSKQDHSSHHHDNIYNTHHHYATDDRLRSSKRAQDRLEEYVSRGAAHDSTERGTDAPKCFPETREAVQGEMLSFVDPGGKEKMLWLSGPAGAGKTAIMGSVAETCQKRRWLAGSFFFSTSANILDRCSKRYFIPTLAYHFFQLGIPGLPAAILASIDANLSVFDKRLDQQVEILLLAPLREVCQKVDLSTWPKVVVVDGVDECSADQGRTYETEQDRQRSKEDNHWEVLSALTQASNDPAFPFRIIIASRPEPAIKRYLTSLPTDSGTKRIFLDNKYNPKADIKLYARAMLTKIGLDRGLGADWFSQVGRFQGLGDVPQYLAGESSGQFVYVATVIRFIQGDAALPHEQLRRVLDWRHPGTSKPFAALDALYTGILQSSPEPVRAALLICASQRFHMDGWYVHAILQSAQGEIGHILGPLQSLVCTVGSGRNPVFFLYHKSLRDFLENRRRSVDLHVKIRQITEFISDRFYAVLKNRGPQVPILGDGTIGEFLTQFRAHFLQRFPCARKYHYTAEDVDWWLATLVLKMQVPTTYRVVHKKCHWYACQSACKVWRKGILHYAKANGWRVPIIFGRLVLPFPYPGLDSWEMRADNILHPPRRRRSSSTTNAPNNGTQTCAIL